MRPSTVPPSDYERLVSDIREMNEHGLREVTLDSHQALMYFITMMRKANEDHDSPLIWKGIMSEPDDKTGRYWIVMEGRERFE